VKLVYDVTLSEMDFVALCQRLGTEEHIMATEMDSQEQGQDAMSRMELNLRLSLFMEGFVYGVNDAKRIQSPERQRAHMNALNDADYAAGFSAGSTCVEQAMELYRQQLAGVAR
jgi:hypothetical protein